jgi:hypothetical protein
MAVTNVHVDRTASLPSFEPRLGGWSDAVVIINERLEETEAILRAPMSTFWTETLIMHARAEARIESDLHALGDRFNDLLNLKAGWLEGDGVAVVPSAASRASLVTLYVLRRDRPRPRVFPTVDGGVQLEWTFGPQQVTIRVEPDLTIFGLRVDAASGAVAELEITDGTTLPAISLIFDPIP